MSTAPGLPVPDADALAHSDTLAAHIRAEIAASGGAIPFSRFMELCLYAPGLGYYSAGSAKFGGAGDFVTAPELGGLFAATVAGVLAGPLRELGAQRALVVWGRDGMDEISLGAGTLVGELRDGEVREYEIHPEDYGIAMAASRNLRVEDAAQSRRLLLEALDGTPGLAQDIVCLNAGAALYVAGVSASIHDGVRRAREVVASGAARARLEAFVQATTAG